MTILIFVFLKEVVNDAVSATKKELKFLVLSYLVFNKEPEKQYV